MKVLCGALFFVHIFLFNVMFLCNKRAERDFTQSNVLFLNKMTLINVVIKHY